MRIRLLLYSVLSKLKTFLLGYKKNISIGKRTRLDFDSKLYVSSKGNVKIGNDCYLKANPVWHHTGLPFRACICCSDNATVSIGDHTRTAAYISAQKNVKIGNGCLLAGGVNIMDSNGIKLLSLFRADWSQDNPEDIVIGDNVWICINSTILKGTRIGANSVVSANSVVKGDFPENVLIQGNPAVIVGRLDL